MKKLAKDSKTKENLMKAFAGEGMARNRYTYFASRAKKEGYEQISSIFLETADNEKEHAKIFFKFLGEDFKSVEINKIAYPAGLSEYTEKNLKFAASGEHEENSILYPSFEKTAREEGYMEIADNIHEIIEVEIIHEKRYLDLLDILKEDKVFKRENEVIWKCRNCGYHYKGKEAPALCPACKHPIAYFEVYTENY